MSVESITLYFREGSSDKFYTVNLDQYGDEGRVSVVYGRIGASGQTGIKFEGPFADAKAEYTRVVKSKMSKGYKPDANSVAYSGISDKTDTGIRSQLLNPIEEEEVQKYISDDEWCAQEKYDGVRKKLKRNGDQVISINRKGQAVGFPANLEKECLKPKEKIFIIDGEEIGSTFWAYDIIAFGNGSIDVRSLSYDQRYAILKNIIEETDMKIAPVYCGAKKKAELFERLRSEKKEGIVFKRISAHYAEGLTGNQVKFKFYSTASCIVIHRNAKRSVAIGLLENNEVIPVGNCLIPVNHKIPEPDDIVEIRYLYAYKGGSLFQPVYLGKRDDLYREDCIISQLKYKADPED